ncbi:MAG: DUF1572 domain-containing protein [Calditrichaeota bacterium]|nr:MAG: DUF1572 domain-containing protein [Calditrichota bacterium]
MNVFVAEYRRYRKLLEGALAQVSDDNFFRRLDEQDNSIAVILNHISGNLLSRFTDFLTSDGEKPWRNRESEFRVEGMTRTALMEKWDRAWKVLEGSVFSLGPQEMQKVVTIRGVRFSVEEALARSLAHFSYHVGQIVYLARHFSGTAWEYLTIPPGQSEQYNENPDKEKGI